MRVRYTQQSRRKIEEIGRYLRSRDPAALTVRADIQVALMLIADHPKAGRAIGRGLRRYVVPRLPYLILYRIDEQAGAIAVAIIRHASRRPLG